MLLFKSVLCNIFSPQASSEFFTVSFSFQLFFLIACLLQLPPTFFLLSSHLDFFHSVYRHICSCQILPQSQICICQQVFFLSLNPWLQSLSDLIQQNWTVSDLQLRITCLFKRIREKKTLNFFQLSRNIHCSGALFSWEWNIHQSSEWQLCNLFS